MRTKLAKTFGVVTAVKHLDIWRFIGDEITLDGERTFRFPSLFEHEFKVGRRIFMDFSAWPETFAFIHIFKSNEEMKKECDGTVDGDDICYVKTYSLLKEFIPWAA